MVLLLTKLYQHPWLKECSSVGGVLCVLFRCGPCIEMHKTWPNTMTHLPETKWSKLLFTVCLFYDMQNNRHFRFFHLISSFCQLCCVSEGMVDDLSIFQCWDRLHPSGPFLCMGHSQGWNGWFHLHQISQRTIYWASLTTEVILQVFFECILYVEYGLGLEDQEIPDLLAQGALI